LIRAVEAFVNLNGWGETLVSALLEINVHNPIRDVIGASERNYNLVIARVKSNVSENTEQIIFNS
jgi:hypothetical protein